MKRPIVMPYSPNRWELASDYEWRGVVVPKGYICNGANIPRVLWRIFPPHSPEYFAASVIHDWLCEQASSNADYKRADEALYRAMRECGARKWKAVLFYAAVRGYHLAKGLIWNG